MDENAKNETPDLALHGDIITLKVDVNGAPEGAKVMFRIYNASMPHPGRFDLVYGEVAGSVGTVEWKVQTPSLGEGKKTSVEFEAKIRNLISERTNINLGTQFKFSI
jgi:hypothetical protein